MMIILFMLRRLVLAATVILLQKYPFAQLSIMIYTSLFLLAYQLHTNPYEFKRFTFFEILNETTILLLTILLIPVSWTKDGDQRHFLGMLLIGVMMVAVGLNVVNFVVSLL
jgi:hypothetical protein